MTRIMLRKGNFMHVQLKNIESIEEKHFQTITLFECIQNNLSILIIGFFISMIALIYELIYSYVKTRKRCLLISKMKTLIILPVNIEQDRNLKKRLQYKLNECRLTNSVKLSLQSVYFSKHAKIKI